MGLIQEERQKGLYLKASGGAITYSITREEYDKQKALGNENAIVITYLDKEDKTEKETYKMKVPGIDGLIVGASYKGGKFGETLDVQILNGVEIGIFQFKSNTGQHNDIVNYLMNTDISKPVNIQAWLWNDRTQVGIEQDGVKIKKLHTKETGTAPQPITTAKRSGTGVDYDFKPVNDFYADYILSDEFQSKFDGVQSAPQPIVENDDPFNTEGKPEPKLDKKKVAATQPEEDDQSDLPF